MTVTGNQLLSALGSGILPAAGLRAEPKGPQGQSFNEVLAKVQRGEPSDLGIQIGKEVRPLDVSIQTRELVGLAADSAAIKGVQRAVVDLGDSVVRLDVTNRVLEAQFDHDQAGVIDRIDGFVSMRGATQNPEDTTESANPHALITARIVRNTSLADLLSVNDSEE